MFNIYVDRRRWVLLDAGGVVHGHSEGRRAAGGDAVSEAIEFADEAVTRGQGAGGHRVLTTAQFTEDGLEEMIVVELVKIFLPPEPSRCAGGYRIKFGGRLRKDQVPGNSMELPGIFPKNDDAK